MASKLDKVLELLVNENEKEASAVLHEWFVERAREIHNQLVEEDDAVLEDELEDEMAAEQFYEAGDEEGEEGDDMDMGDAEMELDGDMGGEEGDDMDGGEVELDDRVDDLEAEIADLKAEFEQLMADEEGEEGDDMDMDMDADEEGDMDMDMGDEGDMDGEEDVKEDDFIQPGHGDMNGVYESDDDSDDEDEDEDEMKESKEEDEGDELEETFELDEDEFADLEESAMALLSDVKGGNSEAEVGTGASKKLAVNKNSPIPSHKVEDRVKGTPVARKSSEHNGFGMESAPGMKMGNGAKGPSNTMKKSKDALSKVQEKGDKSAKLNTVEGGEGNMDSPVPTNKGKKA